MICSTRVSFDFAQDKLPMKLKKKFSRVHKKNKSCQPEPVEGGLPNDVTPASTSSA
jgi:hypothetical protein